MISLSPRMTAGTFLREATDLFGAKVAQEDLTAAPVLADPVERDSTQKASQRCSNVGVAVKSGEARESTNVKPADFSEQDSRGGSQDLAAGSPSPASEQSGNTAAFIAPAAPLAPLRVAGIPSLADTYANGIPPLPSGPPCKTLPSLSEAAGGLYGLWVVMGEPGVGKSALARQIACSAQRYFYVLDYDAENGPQVIAARLRTRFNEQECRSIMARWYVRDSIATMETDLEKIGHKCMVIVDSFQSLPASIEHSTESLSKWMQRFEKIAKDGHFVLLISEKNRAHYGTSSIAGGKGTGALEYKAWFGVSLIGDAEDSNKPVEVHVVKNRHRKKRGIVCYLERVHGGFWFRELSENL